MRETSDFEIRSRSLDHLVDLPRRDAGDVCLLHHRHQCLLGAAARLEEAAAERLARARLE